MKVNVVGTTVTFPSCPVSCDEAQVSRRPDRRAEGSHALGWSPRAPTSSRASLKPYFTSASVRLMPAKTTSPSPKKRSGFFSHDAAPTTLPASS